MSGSTAGHDAGERRAAARNLLATPILDAAHHREQLESVRRHTTALKSMFLIQLGYQLVVESSFARLVKSPLPMAAPVRPARRRTDDKPFTSATYTHLALICAALLAPGVGEQILISALVDQVRADAAEHSITVTDAIGDRRQLVTALGQLLTWGVLAETDGSVTAWGERREDEALLSINRPLLVHLLPSALHELDQPNQTWLEPANADDSPRRRLRRRLVESPAVFRVELPDDELDVLSRERHDLADRLDENFGLVLEVRAEGALAYDPTGTLTDVDFPGAGTVKQAALLLLDDLLARLRPEPSSQIRVGDEVRPATLAPWVSVDEVVTELTVRHQKAWKAAYVDSPAELQADIVALLESLTLARATSEGLAVFPFAARYRPQVRINRPAAQPSLFEEGTDV